ncbi:hypothetical protein IWW57_001776, partial [Coemansia sp. S610]
MHLDLRSVYSGKALDVLLHLPLNGYTFTRVRQITFVCYWAEGEESRSQQQMDSVESRAEDMAVVCAFVDAVKRMAPLVDYVIVQTEDLSTGELQLSDLHFGDIVSRLFQLTNRVSYLSIVSRLPMRLLLDDIRDLVHFSYQSNSGVTDDHALAMQVARQSAPTLKYLCFAARMRTSLSDLFQDSGRGSYTSYPCLLSLVLDHWTPLPVLVPPVSRNVVLFPQLQGLSMSTAYPFSDDVPFRGNAATLRVLDVVASRELCVILQRYRVFGPTSHPGLYDVKVEWQDEGTQDYFESSEAYAQFVLSIGPGAAVRTFSGIPSDGDLSSALSLFKSHACIRVLNLPKIPLKLWDVEFLTRSLPLLTDLSCLSTGLGLMTDDIDIDDYAAFMFSLRNPSRERFRCWRLGEVASGRLHETVQCVLSVALMCPNFTYAAVGYFMRKKFMMLMEEAIESDG